MISIIVPTIRGREAWLERCLTSYCETTTLPNEVIMLKNFPSCNEAWNVGIREAKGEYIHLSADDIEAHPRWAEIALEWTDKGYLPCPRVLNTDGSLQSCGPDAYEHPTGWSSDVARIPFFPRELLPVIYPILDSHFMGDYWVAHQALKVGWSTVVVREWVFTHHLAQEGRLYSLDQDIETYWKAIA